MQQHLALYINDDFQSYQTDLGIMEMAAPPRPLDAILKDCFSFDIVFISFLCDILYQDEGQYIDLKKLKPFPAAFIDKYFSKSFNDYIWVVPWKDHKFKYSYMMLEYQTKNDLDMPYRLLGYRMELMRFCYVHDKMLTKHQFPSIFPIVFHIGNDTWTTCDSVRDMDFPVPEKMAKDVHLHCPYILVDVPTKKLRINGQESDIVRTDSLAFQILTLAHCQTPDEVEAFAPKLMATVQSIPNTEKLKENLAEAIYTLLKRYGVTGIRKFKTMEEAVMTVTQRAQAWRNDLIQRGVKIGNKEGFEKGVEKGCKKKEKEVLKRLARDVISGLRARFGSVTRAIIAGVKAISDWDKLVTLLRLSGEVSSLDEFSRKMQTV